MSNDQPTWIVLHRDISESAHIQGQRTTTATIVLDAATGLAVTVDVGSSRDACVARALKNAVIRPVAPLPKAMPGRIVAPPELIDTVQAAVAKLSKLADTTIIEGVEMWDSEEVFDSFVGHIEGRDQPVEPAAVADWRLLYAALSSYVEAAPWTRWSDEDYFPIRLELDGVTVERTGIVLGGAGIQRGFNATPDPDSLARAADHPGNPMPFMEDSLIVHLDPWHETSGLNATKARRYGWPAKASLVPALLTVHDCKASDLGCLDVRLLALALTGVVQQDAVRLAAVGSKTAVTGEIEFGPGATGTYNVGRPGTDS